jgi:transposase-like protein
MKCPECSSTKASKNSKSSGKQNHICKNCERQFITDYATSAGYAEEGVKRECLKMYVDGLRFSAIERVKDVHYTTVIAWVGRFGSNLPDAYDLKGIPEVGELDELQTFVGLKKTRSGCGRRLTTSGKALLAGCWETIMSRPLSNCGPSSLIGSAISMSPMAGSFTLASFLMWIRL